MQKKSNNHLDHNLIWIDLEMTGLNPDKDHILEIAIAITDQKLNIIDNSFDLVIKHPEQHLAFMSDWVKEVHRNNGLLKDVQESTINLKTAAIKALEFIQHYVPAQTSPICGNSICLDRRFLFKHMPKVEQYFHYRNLDVSTVKNLGIYWFPEKIKNFYKAEGSHRAKHDILQSIEELKFYKEQLFCS